MPSSIINNQRQQLEAQRDALKADQAAAETALAQAETAAAPLLRRGEALRNSAALASLPPPTREEAATLHTYRDAEARCVALTEALKGIERDLAAIDRNEAAKVSGSKAEKALAKAEAQVKATSEHLTKVRQLRSVKQAELERAVHQQRMADEAAARAAVSALLGKVVPTPAPTVDDGAVGRLEAVLTQIDVELVSATREAEAAAQALADLAHPIWHARYLQSKEALGLAVAALLPHLDSFMTAQRKLGWGHWMPDTVDMEVQLRHWQQQRADGLAG